MDETSENKRKLIVGLGNPGKEYDGTRHNTGFMALDRFASNLDATFTEKAKYKALMAEITVNDTPIILLKPQTYYNLVGDAIRPAKDFYKLENEDILVVHDELALPFGSIRTRPGRRDAGNNGVKHIIQTVGPHTTRIRVGIWNEHADDMEATSFVLGKFTKEETEHLDEVLGEVNALMTLFAHGKMPHVTYRLA